MHKRHALLLMQIILAIAFMLAVPVFSMAAQQTVSVTPTDSNQYLGGEDFTLTVTYDADNAQKTGIGLKIHYDSSKLTWKKFSDVFSTNKTGEDDAPSDDTADDFDKDPTTDKYLSVAWASLSGDWPGTIPQVLYRVDFSPIGKGTSKVNISFKSTHQSQPAESNNATVMVSGVPTQLNFTNAALNQKAREKGTMTVELQDADGDPAIVDTDVRVSLASTSTGAAFFDNTGQTEVTSVTIPSGSSSVAFRYADTVAATPTVTGTNASYDDATQQQTIIAGDLAKLTVSPDTKTMTADETQVFEATGVDADGNTVTELGKITWSVNGGIGEIDDAGLFDAITAGTGSVTASSDLGHADTTGDVTVRAGALNTLTVSPDTKQMTADETQKFEATGADADGNSVTDLGTIEWSGGAGIGIINQGSGIFEATTVGSGTVTATSSLKKAGTSDIITDTSGKIEVIHGKLAVLIVAPDTVALTADETQVFTVTGTDTDGNAIEDIGDVTWSGGAGIGIINSDSGLFDATTVGTGTVKASTSSLEDQSGLITVSHGAPANLVLTSNKTKVPSDGKGTATLSGTLQDADGNTVTGDSGTPITFNVTGDGTTHAGWIQKSANTESGVAQVEFTTKGVVADPGSISVSVDASGGGLNATPISLDIINFAIEVDTPGAPFYDPAKGVALVTSNSEPKNATFHGVGGTDGNYRWELASVGTINSTTANAITYTSPESLTGDSAKDTLTLKDLNDPTNLTDAIDILIYKPVRITSPTGAIAVNVGDTSNIVTATGGTGTYAFLGSDDAVATVAQDGAITPVAKGSMTVKVRDKTYGAFDTNNGFLATTASITVYNAAMADFTTNPDPTEGPAPLVVTFTDTSTGDVKTWAWDFGDGDTSTVQNPPAHTYTSGGTYIVKLTVTGEGGGSSEKTAKVTVYGQVGADFIGTPVAGNKDLSVTFSDKSTGPVESWSWTFGDGAASTAQNPSHIYKAAGKYTVKLDIVGSGPDNTASETKIDYITVYTAAVADFSTTPDPAEGPAPLVVSFTDTSTGDVKSWAWDFGDGETSTAQNPPAHTYAAGGNYTVKLTVTGEGGGSSEKTAKVTVYGQVAADFIGTPDAGDKDLSVTFSDKSTGPVESWSWTFGDGAASTAQNPSHTYTAAGKYTVKLDIVGAGPDNTASEIKTDYISVYTAAVADFSITPDPAEGPAPLVVNFTDTSTGDVKSWAWDFGDGETSTVQNPPAHTYAAGGNYTVKLTVTGEGGGSSEKTAKVTVYGQVAADFIGTPDAGDKDLTVTFSDKSTGPVESWSWTFGDGAASTAQNPSHTYTAAGKYTVKLDIVGAGPDNTASETKIDYITVYNPTVADFTTTPDSTKGPAPLVVTFADTSTGDVESWAWDFGDGETSTVQNPPAHTYTSAGTYTVKLTVTDKRGDTSEKSVTVQVFIHVNASFTVSPQSGNSPLMVQFTNTSTGSVKSYAWDFGDTHTSTLRNPSNEYTTNENEQQFTVRLTVTGLGGEEDTVTKNITVTKQADGAPPLVQSTDPTANAANVSSTSKVTIEFDPTPGDAGASYDEMANSTKSAISIADASGQSLPGWVIMQDSKTFIFNHTVAFNPGAEYTVTVDQTKAKDLAGNHLAADYTFKFTVAKETVPPKVSRVWPHNEAEGVGYTDLVIKVKYNEKMADDKKAVFTISPEPVGYIAPTGTWLANAQTCTFTPITLDADTFYQITVNSDGGATDEAGNETSADHLFSFTTAEVQDNVKPTVTITDPDNSATNVAVNASVTVEFSELMNKLSLLEAFSLLGPGGKVAGRMDITDANEISTLVFTPIGDLSGNSNHTIQITTTAKDRAGNALAAKEERLFTTETESVRPTISGTCPVNGAVFIASKTTVVVSFSEAMKNSEFSMEDSLSAIVNGGFGWSDDRKTLTFTPNADLDADETYTVTVGALSADFADNTLGANEKFKFTTAAAADTTAPGISTVLPRDGATDVSVKTEIGIVFSEAMWQSRVSVTTSPEILSSLEWCGSTLVITPSQALAYSTTYTIIVSGAATDLTNNVLVGGDYQFAFTTAAVKDEKAPTVLNVLPVDGKTGVSPSAKVFVTFSEPMDRGTVEAAFEKPVGLEGGVQWFGETLIFSPANDLATATTYTFSLKTNAKDISGNALETDKTWSFETLNKVEVRKLRAAVLDGDVEGTAKVELTWEKPQAVPTKYRIYVNDIWDGDVAHVGGTAVYSHTATGLGSGTSVFNVTWINSSDGVTESNGKSVTIYDVKPPDASTQLNPAQETTLQIGNGASVTIPAQSYGSQEKISITQLNKDNLPTPPPNGATLSVAFEPAGLEFSKPVLIIVPYDSSEQPPTEIFYYDSETGQWTSEGITVIEVDEVNHVIKGLTTHFSAFSSNSSSNGGGGGGGCFISTAGSGTDMQKHGIYLKKFKDMHMQMSILGRTFMQTYYKFASPLANELAQHHGRRTIISVGLLPLVGLLYLLASVSPMLLATMLALALFVGLGTFNHAANRDRQRRISK